VTFFGEIFISLRCKIPELNNDSYEIQNEYHKHLISKYIVIKSENPTVYDECRIKVYTDNNTTNSTSSEYILQSCDSWVFSKAIFNKTIVTDVRRFKNIDENKCFNASYFI
jgi:hypothetical protein